MLKSSPSCISLNACTPQAAAFYEQCLLAHLLDNSGTVCLGGLFPNIDTKTLCLHVSCQGKLVTPGQPYAANKQGTIMQL